MGLRRKQKNSFFRKFIAILTIPCVLPLILGCGLDKLGWGKGAVEITETVHVKWMDISSPEGEAFRSGFCPVCGIGERSARRCGRCHVGGGGIEGVDPKPDCAVCHSLEYDISKRRWDEKLGRWVYSEASPKFYLFQRSPPSISCLRCHQENMELKRGEALEMDVHLLKMMRCTSCHVPQGRHRIPAGKFVVDLLNNDLPEFDLACTGCHKEFHGGSSSSWFSGKHGKLSCESCHIYGTGGVIFTKEEGGRTYFENWWGTVPYEDVEYDNGKRRGNFFVLKWWDGKKEGGKPVFGGKGEGTLWPLKRIEAELGGSREELYIQVSHGIVRPGKDICGKRCHQNPGAISDSGIPSPSKSCGMDCMACHGLR